MGLPLCCLMVRTTFWWIQLVTVTPLIWMMAQFTAMPAISAGLFLSTADTRCRRP